MTKSSISEWGPSAWNFLHTISYSYSSSPTEAQKKNMYNFLKYFATVIPCAKCRIEFSRVLYENMKSYNDVIFEKRQNLVEFLIDMHNYVNKKIGKRIYTYKEIDYLYLSSTNHKCTITFISISIFIIITIILIYKYTRTNSQQHNFN
mgnify:CR=1 FL=1